MTRRRPTMSSSSSSPHPSPVETPQPAFAPTGGPKQKEPMVQRLNHHRIVDTCPSLGHVPAWALRLRLTGSTGTRTGVASHEAWGWLKRNVQCRRLPTGSWRILLYLRIEPRRAWFWLGKHAGLGPSSAPANQSANQASGAD